MLREDLVFVGTCDIAGLVRGKGFPSAELPARRKAGIGWTHSNLMQTCFGPILDTPFGTSGDLMIVPDPSSEVHVDFRDGSAPEHFFLGDIRNTDGTPWDCCVRAFLRRAIGALKNVSGLELLAAFEQEFVYTGVDDVPGHAYSLSAFRRQGLFGEMLMAAIRAASVRPDSFLAEYGPRQYEMTVAPDAAMAAADAGVIAREMARAVAFRLENRAIFSPMPVADGAGNGVHIHFSLHEASGKPVTGAPDGVMGLSPVAARFAAGVLHHLPVICAVTAPSPVSYLRLTPNRWAPTVADLKPQDRGAALRICPVFAAKGESEREAQFNLEFRVCDAAASPYMALGALIFAGADGIARDLALPKGPAPLPKSLPAALDLMEASDTVKSWFGPVFFEAYLRHKRSEASYVADLPEEDLCARYAEVY
ncbi:glutamine synthetase family protein [Methyloceanibacter sp.]|uniref:glutamine synthetase family protein n=1 Tax=Methyloceanibacter sp. TaxID=1965321 RepID=UPI002BB4260B|nr:glutamine synthetase family protein [Methyloceanibacter sp.]HML93717.1 glutamine synthetase family protein [Methyloceanibacter sp.]